MKRINIILPLLCTFFKGINSYCWSERSSRGSIPWYVIIIIK